MKSATLSLALAVLTLVGTVSAQSPRYPAPEKMQTVHIALLYRGPNATTGPATPEQQKLQEAHMAHLNKMALVDKALWIAGPMAGTGDLRGIVVFKTATAAEALALQSEDPSIKAGRLRVEMVSYMTPGNWFSFGPLKDDLPMRRFVFGFLTVGANPPGTPEDAARIQDDHLANLWTLRESGALVSAAPMIAGAKRAGVVNFALDSVDKATELLASDPAVKSGRFGVELYPWFAADGILKGK